MIMHYAVNPQFKGHKKMHSDIYSVPQGIHLHKLPYHIIAFSAKITITKLNIFHPAVTHDYLY